MAASAQLADQPLFPRGPPTPVATYHYQRVRFKDATKSLHPVAAQIDLNFGLHRALIGYHAKTPFGEIGWDGRAVERKGVRDYLGDHQRNARTQAAGESARLP